MNIIGFLATPFGYVMEFIYNLLQNYGWSIILFTILIRLLMFPLNMKQQKSTARMSAYQPHIQEIQKKFAKDKQRQQEELMKFQQEHGMSMTAGCLPMALNMVAIFSVIQVVYMPLKYILHIKDEVVTAALGIAGISNVGYTAQSALLDFMNHAGAEKLGEIATAFGDQFEKVASFNMSFLGIDLAKIPSFNGFPNIDWALLIFPVLSLVTMVATQIITMKMSGQEIKGAMKWMPWIMSAFFVYVTFTIPVAFSLYYTISNILMLVQSLILKKIYDPEKIKAEINAEIEAKKEAKKKRKTITVTDENGQEVEKAVTESELARIRLAKARQMDEEKYKD